MKGNGDAGGGNMARWHYASGGQQSGPIEEEELKGLLGSGRLPASTLVWTDGMPNWVAAASLPALFVAGPPGPPPVMPVDLGSTKIAAGVCGILLGGLGIHKFVLGMNKPALIMLGCTLGGAVLGPCTHISFLAPVAMGVVGLAEGIIYLVRPDQEFYQTYVVGKREWF